MHLFLRKKISENTIHMSQVRLLSTSHTVQDGIFKVHKKLPLNLFSIHCSISTPNTSFMPNLLLHRKTTPTRRGNNWSSRHTRYCKPEVKREEECPWKFAPNPREQSTHTIGSTHLVSCYDAFGSAHNCTHNAELPEGTSSPFCSPHFLAGFATKMYMA